MQYTLRNIPRKVDQALRAKAKAERKSINRAAVDALKAGLGISDTPTKKRDLSDIAGTWVDDPLFEQIRQEHEQIDPEIWR
jgi:hypothetical protein